MKKSICLFLLMLAATFQVAFAQEEPLNPDPCTVMEKPIEIFGAFTSEKCPDCLFAWVGSYDENQASAIQILSFEIIPNDNVNKEVCEGCLTASEIVQMAFVDMMFRLRKMGVWSERITQTSAYLKPCWFKTYTEVSDEYYQEKLSLAAQNEVVEKTPIAEKKSGEEIQGASNHTSIKFFFCPSYDVCCFSKIKVEFYMENHELKFKIIVLDRSYDTKCSDEDCQPMCDALNFDKYAKREIEAEVIESYVTLYPIPARDIISVNWGGWETDLSFELFDMLGNVVGKHTLLAKDNNATFELNLRSGSYSYRILSEGVIVKQGNLSIVK